MKRRDRISMLMAITAVGILAIAAPGHSDAQRQSAGQVGYFTAPIHGSGNVQVSCTASTPSLKGPVVIATATEYTDGAFGGGIFYNPRWSHQGEELEVAGHQLRYEARRTSQDNESSSFNFGSGWATDDDAFKLHVAWGLWGSPASCTAEVNGVAVDDIHYLSGSYAYFVGPDSYTGGVYYQSGAEHASVVRTYDTALNGGPLWAHARLGAYGVGTIATDARPLPRDCRSPNGDPCTAYAARAAKLSISIGAAYDLWGTQGDTIVISLPQGL